jgi:hypothetical protein
VSLSVADGATDVAPRAPLEITVDGGELAEVTVVTAGTEVPGTVEDGAGGGPATWTAEEPLAYGTEYRVTATATADGSPETEAEATADFTTVTPGELFTPSIGPLDGTVVGVGMPIRVFFDQPVPDGMKGQVEQNLEVDSSNPTDGVWSWLTDTDRPTSTASRSPRGSGGRSTAWSTSPSASGTSPLPTRAPSR